VTTTVSITRCCKKAQPRLRPDWPRLDAAAWAALLILALALVWPAFARADNVAAEVTQLRVERGDEGLMLSSQVRFELPPVIEDALAKGIPMYFLAEATVWRDRWYWTDKRVATAYRYMRLSFQPLTRRWRLQVSSAPIASSGLVLGQNFDSRDEALSAMQRTSGWRIASLQEVEPDAVHNVEFRFRLDVSQLPRPFQIGAVGQSEWQIVASRFQRLAIEPAK
jgi:hypothetical protein